MKRGVVFLGPSLPENEAWALLEGGPLNGAALLEWEVRPPVRMGDVYALLSPEVVALVVIDGVFHGQPAIWHRELLAALDGGVRVIGASSMGALRAAELDAFGMEGYGQVYEWYREGIIDADDEVALRHGPADASWLAMSTPLVNTRATVASALASGAMAEEEAATIIETARARFYPERTPRNMSSDLVGLGWAADRVSRVMETLKSHAVDVKKADALLALAGALGPARRHVPVPVAEGPCRWRRERLLRADLGGSLGDDRARALSAVPGLRRRVMLEAFVPDGGEGTGATFARVPEATLAWANVLPGELERLARRRESLSRAVTALGSLESAALAGARERGLGLRASLHETDATDPALEPLLRAGPSGLGLSWESDVAFLEAWQSDVLWGPPDWAPSALARGELDAAQGGAS